MNSIVIGGGAVGCAVAWRLAQRGVKVTLIERGPLSGEASSAAAGILAPQVEAQKPGPLFDLKCRSRALWPAFAEELRAVSEIDVGYRRTGTVLVALDEAQAAGLRARFDWQRAAGLRVEWLDRVAGLGPMAAILHLPDDHQVDPRRLGAALATAAGRAGVRVVHGTARRLLSDGQRVTGLFVDEERLEADTVVLAGGAWSTLLEGLPPLPRVRPLRGQIVELRAAPGLLGPVVFGDLGYLVPRPDGRVLVGSSEDDVGFVKEVTPPVLERLLQRAVRLAPALAGAAVTGFWAGFRPTTDDHHPLLGRAALDGLYLATGHHRNGILLAPVSGEILASVVTGGPLAADLAAFSPLRG